MGGFRLLALFLAASMTSAYVKTGDSKAIVWKTCRNKAIRFSAGKYPNRDELAKCCSAKCVWEVSGKTPQDKVHICVPYNDANRQSLLPSQFYHNVCARQLREAAPREWWGADARTTIERVADLTETTQTAQNTQEINSVNLLNLINARGEGSRNVVDGELRDSIDTETVAHAIQFANDPKKFKTFLDSLDAARRSQEFTKHRQLMYAGAHDPGSEAWKSFEQLEVPLEMRKRLAISAFTRWAEYETRVEGRTAELVPDN